MNIFTNTASRSRGSITLPGAIIIAGAIVAIAIIWTQRPAGGPTKILNIPSSTAASNMAPVTSADHILGNPDAPIKIVEYSDPSCPFCKTFNQTMTRIMDQYGPTGKVAWVYRQFPLDKPDANGSILHPNSGRQATALECAAYMGGNTAFFAFEKKWYELFPIDGANRSRVEDDVDLLAAAKSAGLAESAFKACLDSDRFRAKLDRSYAEGLSAGVTGTPYTVIVTPSGSHLPLPGLVTFTMLKQSIDTLISSLPATAETQPTTAQ